MKHSESHLNVTKIIPYHESVKNFLKQNQNEENDIKEFDNQTFGGILTDINYAYLCNGPRLEVISTKTGSKVAAWTFGEVIKDYYTRITCVIDLPNISTSNKSPVLIVGLQSAGTRGMICIFDIRTSRVLRAINFPKPVTSLHVINSTSLNFPGPLRSLDGVLSVGMEHGHIYLLDLNLPQCEESITATTKTNIHDEISPCDTFEIQLNQITNLEKIKETIGQNGDQKHICIELNEGCTNVDFVLKGPKNEVRLKANIVEVKISALHYSKQLGSILVGYNFGAFQIYDLLTLRLVYTSPAYEDCIPVSHFAFQEPSDDPRAFCYIWVIYSNSELDTVTDLETNFYPLAVMYSLSYETKEFLEGYGNLYQTFLTCSIRFQTELKNFSQAIKITSNSKRKSCIALNAYARTFNEDNLALIQVVWIINDIVNMCLFDLNQWYKEQMPTNPTEHNQKTYLHFLNLTPYIELGGPSGAPPLNFQIDPKTLNQFITSQRLEEHFYPNSLSFTLVCLLENAVVLLENVGVQKNLLNILRMGGPLVLLRPLEIYQECISLGLNPLGEFDKSIKGQRSFILSVALENQLVSFLFRCAEEWGNGSQSVTGCTIEFLIEWAWERVRFLKGTVDDICKTLFDYSGVRLDSNGMTTLNDCGRQLKILVGFFEFVSSEKVTVNVGNQFENSKMVCVYVEVLQWLVNVGLLPECPIFMYPRDDELERISAPYPVDSLTRYYKKRRMELFQLQGFPATDLEKSCDLLFIDNLIDIECGGGVLHSDWLRDGGSGLYPPPSLQALLRTYLIENVSIIHKHCIFIYVFLDLAMTLDQSRYSPIITHLIKFPAVFKLSPAIIKLTQAFWQLDHSDFSTSMAQLLDPLISNEVLKPWHHRIAVKTLLAQGQHQHALLYHQVRNPPMTKVQDLIVTITVLIVNDLLKEAFHFQRQNRSECNEKEIVRHFIEVCDKANKLYQVIQLPLNETEEIELIKFLSENRREETENFLVQYFLQRSRFAEAFETNQKINKNYPQKRGLLGQSEMSSQSRNSLVSRYLTTLPMVTQEVLTEYLDKNSKNLSVIEKCQTFDRPNPMSVFVHKSQDKLKYKSSLIKAGFDKTKEIWSTPSNKNVPFLSTPKTVKNHVSNATPVINPVIIETILVPDENPDEPPSKRIKLSPRKPIHTEEKNEILNLTPIVKRKIQNFSFHSERLTVSNENIPGSPQSILKVKKLVFQSGCNEKIRSETCTTPENIDFDSDSDLNGCTPFDELTKKNTSKSSLIDLSDFNVATPKKSVRMNFTPSVCCFEDRVSTSSENSNSNSEVEVEMEVDVQVENITDNFENESTPKVSSPRKRKLNDSIQSRRSYKNISQTNFNKTSSILDSIDQKLDEIPSEKIDIEKNTPTLTQQDPSLDNSKNTPISQNQNQEPISDSKRKSFPKVTGRKSLTRKVLEQNTLTKALSSSPVTRKSLRMGQKESKNHNTSGVELSHTETVKTLVKETFLNKIEKSENKNVYESKNTFSTSTDPSDSTQIIKISHNESHTKSSSKLTEFLDDSDSDISSIDPILTQGSDIDESFLIKYVKTASPNNLTDSLTENTQEDITEDILQEENEDIVEIQSLDQDKESSDVETEEFVSIENSGKEMTNAIVETLANNSNQFEITDDLTDEDVSFTIHSTMNVEVDPNKNENILEMKDIEPENYLEPNFEEEVRTVLGENSEVDEQFLSKYTETQNENQNQNQNETIEDEKEEDPRKNFRERDENVEKIEVSEDSSEESSEESDDQDSSESSSENPKQTEDQNDVIEIDSSSSESEDDLRLQVDESQENIPVFEKNITDTPNLTAEFEPNLNQNVSESNYDQVQDLTETVNEGEIEFTELAPMEIGYQNNEIYQTYDSETTTVPATVPVSNVTVTVLSSEVQDVPQRRNRNRTRSKSVDVENVEKRPLRTTRSRKASTDLIENDFLPSLDVLKESDEVFDGQEKREKENLASLNLENQKIVTVTDDKPTSRNENLVSDSKLESSETAVEKVESSESLPLRKTRRVSVSSVSESKDSDEVKPRRGRKPSVSKENQSSTEKESQEEIVESAKVPARRGRKPSQDLQETATEKNTPKRRGRRPSVDSAENSEVTVTPSRRTTRRTSLLPEIPEPIPEVEKISTPSRNTRARSVISEDEPPKITTPRRTRRLSTQSEEVNQPLTPSRRGRRPSIQSEDVKLTPSRKTRASSVVSDSVQSPKSQKSTEAIEEYVGSHRLTRRQKILIEEKMKIDPPKGNLDPLTLLDKETFSGEPDLDESQFHQKSPASSICTESSVGTRSSLRIQSKRTTPDRSYTESPSLPSTPRRGKTRASLIKIDQPILEEEPELIIDENQPSTSKGPSKRKSITDYAIQKVFGEDSPAKRTRKHSEDSVASEVSVQSEAIVKLSKIDTDKEIERLRHRSLSPNTLKTENVDSPSKVQRKGRRSILPKTDLTKISEENNATESENVSTKSEGLTVPKKRGRPKKGN